MNVALDTIKDGSQCCMHHECERAKLELILLFAPEVLKYILIDIIFALLNVGSATLSSVFYYILPCKMEWTYR